MAHYNQDISDLELSLSRLGIARNVPQKVQNPKIVYFDVQSTALGMFPEVIQLAVRYGGRMYCDYVMPNSGLTERAMELTGLVIRNHQMLNALNNNRRVPAVSKKVAVGRFLNFLRSIGGNILLVAHNCLSFDARTLIALIHEVKELDEFKRMVFGFSGVFPLLRRKWKRAYKGELQLPRLAENFLGERVICNDSSVHTKWLQKLVNHPSINICDAELLETLANTTSLHL